MKLPYLKSGTQRLVPTILPEKQLSKNVTYSSSDESVATVDENGVVTAVGTAATITATQRTAAKPLLYTSLSRIVVRK